MTLLQVQAFPDFGQYDCTASLIIFLQAIIRDYCILQPLLATTKKK